MPAATEPGPVATPSIGSAPTRPGSQRRSHAIVGATPTTLPAAISLATSAQADGGRLEVEAVVTNLGAGHAFPTGISIRNAFLVVEARREGVLLAQVSGPVVPWWANDDDPTWTEGDYAGQPGSGFAKILEGEINGQLTAPVLFVDADAVRENSTLPAGAARSVVVRFDLGAAAAGDDVTVTARLLYRKAFRALSTTKGWTTTPSGGPIEIEVASEQLELVLSQGDLYLFADGFEVGSTAGWSATVP